MIRFKYFLEALILAFLTLHTKKKRCGQMGPTPSYLRSQVVSVCQVLGLVAPLFFSGKISFLNTERGAAIETYLRCYPGGTASKYI